MRVYLVVPVYGGVAQTVEVTLTWQDAVRKYNALVEEWGEAIEEDPQGEDCYTSDGCLSVDWSESDNHIAIQTIEFPGYWLTHSPEWEQWGSSTR